MKTQRLLLSPDFHSLVQGWDLRICMPHRFPGGADAASLGTTSLETQPRKVEDDKLHPIQPSKDSPLSE